MNYKKIYTNLIDRSKNRLLECYTERHHIIPRCMGGSNNEENIARLTPEEHYIAHLLLVKIYPKNSKLVYAANMMANRNNKSYGWIKRKFAVENSKSHKGLKHSEETKQKMKDAIRARRDIDEESFISEQRRRSRRPKTKKEGYFQPKKDSHREAISRAAKSRVKTKCIYCEKYYDKPNMAGHLKREHSNKC